MERIYPAPDVKIVTVTPDYAQELLNKMATNRPLRPSKRGQYEKAMSGGSWFLTGQGITIDWFDRTIDGEHRLRSIVATGTPQALIILYGADPASRAAIDDGAKRSFADDLFMAGTPEATSSAAQLRRISLWDGVAERFEGRGGLAGIGHHWISRTEMNDLWASHEKDIAVAVKIANKYKPLWPGNSGSLTFMAWLLRDENPSTVARFFSIMVNGSQDSADRPLLQVRQALSGTVTAWKRDHKQAGVEYEVFWLIRGWNAWLKREKLARLSLGKGGLTNPFPKITRTR
jgi:hypothetical protein